MSKKKKTFRVQAEIITYCYLDVEATSKEEAHEIAEATDGGEFVTMDDGGDFNILETLTSELKPNQIIKKK